MNFAKRNFIQNTYALLCFKYFFKIIGIVDLGHFVYRKYLLYSLYSKAMFHCQKILPHQI